MFWGAYHAHFAELVITNPLSFPKIGVFYVQVSVTTRTPAVSNASAIPDFAISRYTQRPAFT